MFARERMRCGQTFLFFSTLSWSLSKGCEWFRTWKRPLTFQWKMKIIAFLSWRSVAAFQKVGTQRLRLIIFSSWCFWWRTSVWPVESGYFSCRRTDRPDNHLVALGSTWVYFKVCFHSFHIVDIFSSRFVPLCRVDSVWTESWPQRNRGVFAATFPT